MMRKILIITYAFPPSAGMGARRPFGFAKYLPMFGWEPIILTPKLPERSFGKIRVIETDYNDIVGSFKSQFGFKTQEVLHKQPGIPLSKNYYYPIWKSKIIELVKEIITFPDEKKGWYKSAIKSVSEHLSMENIDAIISTSPPVIAHLIASKVKIKFKIPWIADYRDLWSQDTLYVKKSRVRRYLEKRLELSTLKYSDAVITVSEPYAEKLRTLLSSQQKKIYVVTNGIEPDDFHGLHENLSYKFIITYTGSLYGGGRDPSPLFIAIQKLINENKIDPTKIEIRFYGSDNFPELLAAKYRLKNVVNVYDKVSYRQSLENQINSTVLLIVEQASNCEWPTYPGKIFEYLGAKRPILAIAPGKGAIANLLTQTMSGFATVDPSNISVIIKDWYDQFIMYGKVKFTGIDSEIQKYNRQNKTRELSAIISSILN